MGKGLIKMQLVNRRNLRLEIIKKKRQVGPFNAWAEMKRAHLYISELEIGRESASSSDLS